MKCKLATDPSSPAYTTEVTWYSPQTSHSLPSRYFDTSPVASWKQVMRPFWMLAPKLPRKYPLVETSPNFGRGAGGGRVVSALAGAGVPGSGGGAEVSEVEVSVSTGS